MIKRITLKGQEIQYDLERKSVKNINLRIKPDQTIYMSVNDTITQETIDDFLQSKADFILKALKQYAEYAKYTPKPKQYVDGESFRILGHDKRLKVIADKKNHIECNGTFIFLYVKDPSDFSSKKRIMNRWLNTQCRIHVKAICEAVYPKFQKYGIEFPEVRFRNMISQWGSCQPKRKILTFNYALVEAPISCIEYVVTHEFTHFLQPNHSKQFYTQLSMFMPDWENRKTILEKSRFSFTE